MPLVLLATFVLCPVFISVNAPSLVQKLFPPYLYLTGIHKTGGLLDLLAYSGIALAFALVASAIRVKSLRKK